MIVLLISKDRGGLYRLEIEINNRNYTYYISSSYAIDRFEYFTRKQMYGKAISVLNKFKLTMEDM